MSKTKSHSFDYFVLALILAVAFLAVKFLSFTKPALVIATFALSVCYVLWGIYHHKKAGHIDKKIMLEYTGIALLGNIIIFTLII